MDKFDTKHYYKLAVSTTVFITGTMGARVLVPLLSNDLNADPTEIGIIVALYSFFPLILVVPIGKWIDKVGSKKPIIISTLIGSISLLIPSILNNLIGIYLLQIIAGLTQTTFAISAQKYMGNTENGLRRENNIALFSIGVSIGSLSGPLIAGMLSDWFGYSRAFAMLGGLSIFSTLILFTLLEKENLIIKSNKKEKSKLFDLLKVPNLRIAFFISGLVLLGKDIYITYFPLLAIEFGLSNKTIGFIVSVNAAAGILIRWFMPLLITKFGRNPVIFLSIFLSGFFSLGIPLFDTVIYLSIISFFLGMGLGIGQPMSITTTMISLPKDRIGEGLGLRLSVNRLTQVVAPVIFGIIAEITGFAAVFIIAGVLLVSGSLKTKFNNEESTQQIDIG